MYVKYQKIPKHTVRESKHFKNTIVSGNFSDEPFEDRVKTF